MRPRPTLGIAVQPTWLALSPPILLRSSEESNSTTTKAWGERTGENGRPGGNDSDAPGDRRLTDKIPTDENLPGMRAAFDHFPNYTEFGHQWRDDGIKTVTP